MEIRKIITSLCSFPERQLEGEKKASVFIEGVLRKYDVLFSTLSFNTSIPKFKKYFLKADGLDIDCLPTGLVSGSIQNFSENSINFNSKCRAISRANFYFKPSLAVKEKDFPVISKAKNLRGELEIEKINHKTKSFLVGNLKNPRRIIFTHFDSIEMGAIDNASGTAVCLNLCVEEKHILKENLFVFDSNEELSYDEPIYWGHGYREFERQYLSLLEKCESILVVDCVGYSKEVIYKDSRIMKAAFPIKNMRRFSEKIKVYSGDFDELMKVYHSKIDVPKLLKDELLQRDRNKILEELEGS